MMSVPPAWTARHVRATSVVCAPRADAVANLAHAAADNSTRLTRIHVRNRRASGTRLAYSQELYLRVTSSYGISLAVDHPPLVRKPLVRKYPRWGMGFHLSPLRQRTHVRNRSGSCAYRLRGHRLLSVVSWSRIDRLAHTL